MDRSFVFAILAAVIWGFAPALEKVGLRGAGMDPFLGVFIRTVPIAVFAMLGVLLMGRMGEVASIDMKSLLFVGAGGLVAGLFGQFAFYAALKSGEASVVVPVAATYPLVALIISVVFLGEAFTIQKLAGIALVVGGVALLK